MTKLEFLMTNESRLISSFVIRISSLAYFIFMLIKNSAFVFVFMS